jgi:hypothetical protein
MAFEEERQALYEEALSVRLFHLLPFNTSIMAHANVNP